MVRCGLESGAVSQRPRPHAARHSARSPLQEAVGRVARGAARWDDQEFRAGVGAHRAITQGAQRRSRRKRGKVMSDQLQAAAEKIGVGSYRRHVFLCTGPTCCSPETGQEAWETLKKSLKNSGL